MDRRIYSVLVGMAVAAAAFWLVRRRRHRDDELFVAPRPEWTAPHGDPLTRGRL